jgi:hypothetical protein
MRRHMLNMLVGLLREHPVIEDYIQHFDEMVEIVGLFEIGIHAQPVRLGDVLVQARAAQHHRAEPRELGLVAQPMKDFEASHPRHFQIKDEQIWQRELATVSKLAFAFQILNNFHPISDFKHSNGLPAPAQGKLKETAIVRIVFSQQSCKINIHVPPKNSKSIVLGTVGGSPNPHA